MEINTNTLECDLFALVMDDVSKYLTHDILAIWQNA